MKEIVCIGQTVLLIAALAALASAQRLVGPNPNTVDEYDYEDGGLPARPQPQPRSYAPNQPRLGAAQPKPTPVPILKQINRHNDDGSYTYGFEGADGSFKIETKLVTGEVMGKYGYVDDSGKVRVVEYGANKFGFQPAGEGITVAPPTLVDETRLPKAGRQPGSQLSQLSIGGQTPSLESQEDIYDDGQYYEEPATAAPLRAPARRPQQAAPRPRAQTPQYFENSFSAPAAAARPSPIPNNFAQFTQTTSFASSPALSPARPLAAPRFSSGLGPAPPRAQVPGAAPAGPGPAAYRALPPAPAPVREPQPQQAQQALFVPQSQLPGLSQHYAPAAPAPAPLPRRPAPARGSGGLLDQLARDYALPQNSAQPLVDTSFGFY
ncbi:Endocuticle structural glycoprotein SgAbd-9 [Frankliniella fusca]|uniref:Endocuticle structural glycoprotein SgAbd-9 n=1 Tax=Frankliniella fusca TaxID=407009 RepID=A0AAE1HXK3_9NEOP|nr:Endocuticle structural glycoprotein SgAbd-9 [Frankliniella fusca]